MIHDAAESCPPQVLPTPLVRSDSQSECNVTRSGAPIPPGYSEMMDQLRLLLDRVAAASPTADMVTDITKLVQELNARLIPYEVAEAYQLSGQLIDVPGRAQLLTPPYHVDELDEQRMAGHVRFGRHYLGSNGAVHGGAIPQLFDDMLGRLALVGDRPKSRTAYLHIDYRSITPLDEDLQIEGWFDREGGRKRYLRGVIRHEGRVCAEAEGLFVALRPGQP